MCLPFKEFLKFWCQHCVAQHKLREHISKEREGFRLSLPALLPVSFGILPELNQPRLVRVQFQAELRQPLSELNEKTFGFCPAFEAHHKIVSVADDNYFAHRHFLAPSFYPQIENVV